MSVKPLFAYVSHSDLRIAGRVRHWYPPRWFCRTMVAATRFGDGWGWAALALVLGGSGADGRAALVAGLIAAAVSIAGFTVLKHVFKRPRPCELGPHPLFHVEPPDRFSFPSGHTMAAASAGAVLALYFPPLAPLFALLALAIATSRVVLGLHYVSDVVVGAILGTLIGVLTFVTVA
jgi:undecaprenyl-diphosphatase